MATTDKTLTSVKIKSDLFNEFKIECVKRKFSFPKTCRPRYPFVSYR